jgi:hypothetical protein
MKRTLFIIVVTVVTVMATTAGITEAVTVGTNPKLLNPLGETNSITDLLKKIVDWMAVIATPIATGMIIFGAFQMLFAGGSPEKFTAGKRTILYTVVGYAIILIGWGFTSIITELLSSA